MSGQPGVFDEDSRHYVHGAGIADEAATAGATYTATEQAMINSLKTKLNAALAALRSAGIIAND